MKEDQLQVCTKSMYEWNSKEPYSNFMGFPGSSVVEKKKIHLPMQETLEMETWISSLGQEDPLEKEMATYSSILPGKFHGQRSLEGYSPWGHKESDRTEQEWRQYF